ncbi:CDP-glycerol glycerophosphotransferase [Micrococcales bacterium KH10]|nr:CDP-glycerol glycerophosphotransferase [Micrococcales bacterium KH10]
MVGPCLFWVRRTWLSAPTTLPRLPREKALSAAYKTKPPLSNLTYALMVPSVSSSLRRALRVARNRLGSLSRRNRVVRRILAGGNNARLVLRDNVLPVRSDPNLVVFASFSGRSVAGSPLAIYEHLLSDPAHSSLRFVWAVRDSSHTLPDAPLIDNDRTTTLRYGSREFCRAMRAAGVWVSSTTMPEHIRRRPQQRYVQTWHGTPLKKLGRDIPADAAKVSSHDFARRYRHDAKRMTHLLSSSPFTSRVFASAFSLDELGKLDILREVGNPRNDRLVAAASLPRPEQVRLRDQLRDQIGLPLDATVVLYAPTWRDTVKPSARGYGYDVSLDLEQLRESWGRDVVIAFRAHYLMTAHLGEEMREYVIDVSHIPDVNDLLLSSDALITDYSSVFFDFALLGRPMYFYVPDLDHYAGSARGLYLDSAELPGPVVRTNADLAATPPPGQRDSDDYTAFLERFATWDDGAASRRLIAQVWRDTIAS